MSRYRFSIKRYDLDNATIDKVVQEFGNYLQVVGASTDSATISVTPSGEKLQAEGRLPIQNRDIIRVPDPFNRVALTWDAQPGEWLDLMFLTQDPAPEEFEYIRGQRTTVDSIAQVVRTAAEPNNGGAMSKVTVGTSSATVVAADGDATASMVRNFHATNILYVSLTSPATTNDFPVNPGEIYIHDNIAALYGIADGASTDVRVSKGTRT